MDELKDDIGKRFVKIRKNLDITQKELADRLNVSLGTLQGYEYGKFPKADVLEDISSMGYDLNWLFNGQGNMFGSQANNNFALDRMLLWNVAYFMSRRLDGVDDPTLFANAFMDMFEEITEEQNAASEDGMTGDDNIINFIQRRMNSK